MKSPPRPRYFTKSSKTNFSKNTDWIAINALRGAWDSNLMYFLTLYSEAWKLQLKIIQDLFFKGNRGVKMMAKCIACNSKSSLISSDYVFSNKDICPFTLESIKGCKTRNSIVGRNYCFFMLEPCYSLKRGKLEKSADMTTAHRMEVGKLYL